jgi:hypothetical protein
MASFAIAFAMTVSFLGVVGVCTTGRLRDAQPPRGNGCAVFA